MYVNRILSNMLILEPFYCLRICTCKSSEFVFELLGVHWNQPINFLFFFIFFTSLQYPFFDKKKTEAVP